MNDDDRLDLSELDPMRDPAHWRSVLDATMARVDGALSRRAQREDALSLIASWVRPVLIAAGIVLTLLIPAEIALESREARVERIERLVALSTQLAHGPLAPTGLDFLRALANQARP